MNKMDEYYKKQLSDHTPAEDGWNIPSEEIWNKAQPHFPKPKKKRKFIFFFLSLGILLLVSTYFFTKSAADQPLSATINSVPSEGVTEITTESKIEQIKTTTETIKEPISNSSSTINSTEKTIASFQNQKTDESIQNKPQVKEKSPLANLSSSTVSQPEKIVNVSTNDSSLSSFNAPGSIAIGNVKTSQNLGNFSGTIANENPSTTKDLISMALINSLETKLLRNDHQISVANVSDKPLVIDVVKSVPFTRNEIGIGSSLHLLSLLGPIKNGDNPKWPDEEIYFNTYRNKNLNLHYHLFISKNWFLSTGAYYDRLNLNVYGDSYIVFDQESIDGHICTNLDDSLSEGFTNNRQSNEYKIELVSGQSIAEGDTLGIGLDVDLSLDVIQIPILLNKRWNIKRTEIFVGLGGSFGRHTYRLRSADIELFRDGNLISKPYQEGPGEVEHETVFDFIFQTGINYNINNKLKFGIAGRLFAPSLFPTGVEARFLYRL